MRNLYIFFFVFLTCLCFAQPTDLKKQISAITKDKDATVAVSVKGIDFDFQFNNENSNKKLPMLSVFKFHIALAVLDLVDQGKLDSEKRILIKKSDLLENTWSPIREKYPQGNIQLSYAELIDYMVAQSDNNACDFLLKVIGGPKSVQEFMESKKVKNFQIKFNEEQMHQDWNAQYENFTSTESYATLLKDFHDGKIVSSTSTDFLMKIMLGTSTGKNKLKEQLPQKTPIAHKTGSSGKTAEGLTGAENDGGIITLPNGKKYAIAVFVNDSKETEEINCKMISDISKTVWDFLYK